MRVFVLTTGRAASKTFARASKFLEGMSAGHETHAGKIFERLKYPDNHVEVDNRLAWFLGSLDRSFPNNETFYVHLTRDPEKVAESYLKRWHIKVSVVRAFYHGILMNPDKPEVSRARDSSRFFVRTVTDNIQHFLAGKSNWCEVRVEHLTDDFFAFMDQAGLQGDRDKISGILGDVSNANKEKYDRVGPWKRFFNQFSDRRLNR